MHSSVVLDTTAKELKDNKGLVFKVKDWDRVGKNDELGQATVSPETLLEATGEDMELAITPPTGHEKEKAGFITFRCRPATEEDRKPKSGLFQRLGLNGSKWLFGGILFGFIRRFVSPWLTLRAFHQTKILEREAGFAI